MIVSNVVLNVVFFEYSPSRIFDCMVCSLNTTDHPMFSTLILEKRTGDDTVEYSAERIFDQDNIQDNIRHNHCKSSPGIGIFKRIASKSKFDISIGTK